MELLVTVDMGPRIIRFGFIGKENEFCEAPDSLPHHRWAKVEDIGRAPPMAQPGKQPRTYVPDEEPVEWEQIENGIRVSQKVEPWVQIKKDMEITLAGCCNKVRVIHKLTNKNAWPVELALWALTVVAPGGKEIIPQPKRILAFLETAYWLCGPILDERP